MPRRTDISHVLVIGSGRSSSARPVNSTTPAPRRAASSSRGPAGVAGQLNPATIMTDPEFADATYIEPITPNTSRR